MTRFQKLYEPACVILDTEFDFNTFGTLFIHRIQEADVILLERHSYTQNSRS
jgi:hypothetical protein